VTATTVPIDESTSRSLAERLIAFLETGTPPPGLFASDVFCDFTMPCWRLQAQGVDGVVRLRRQGHPVAGTVPRWRFDPTPTGFVVEFEERWTDASDSWYSREMARADVVDGTIGALSVYCTGDWDDALLARHAQEVTLLRA
jgi:hypothetical protein